jgi:hypothetical protein
MRTDRRWLGGWQKGRLSRVVFPKDARARERILRYIANLKGGMDEDVVSVLGYLNALGPEVRRARRNRKKVCDTVPRHRELGLLRALDEGNPRGLKERPVGILFCGREDGTYVVVGVYPWESWSPRKGIVAGALQLARKEGCVAEWWDLPERERTDD